jgi:hypothetical protein
VANDEEHAKLLIAAEKESGEKPGKSTGPPLYSYTPEVEAITALINEVRSLRLTFIAANSKAGAPVPKFEPYPIPQTAMMRVKERADYERRKRAHEALRARVLPRKYGPGAGGAA